MKKKLPEGWQKKLIAKIAVLPIACLYFGLLGVSMYKAILKEGVTESIIRLAVVVTVFAAFSYIMFFYSKNRMKSRHVVMSTENEMEITKTRIVFERITAVLFLVLGVVFMVLLLLRAL